MKKQKILILSAILFFIDFGVKQIIRLGLTERVTLIPNVLYLNYTENKGGAWGIFHQYPILLIIISLFFFFFLLSYIRKQKTITKLESISYSLILGGLLGNLFDRIFFGYVIDYIEVLIASYHFPIFNLADTFLVIGICLWIIELIRGEKNEV